MLWFNLLDKIDGNNVLYLIMNILASLFSIVIILVPIYNIYQKKHDKEIIHDTGYLYILSLLVFFSGLLTNFY